MNYFLTAHCSLVTAIYVTSFSNISYCINCEQLILNMFLNCSIQSRPRMSIPFTKLRLHFSLSSNLLCRIIYFPPLIQDCYLVRQLKQVLNKYSLVQFSLFINKHKIPFMKDILNLVVHGELKAPLPLLFVSHILASRKQNWLLVSLLESFFQTPQSMVFDQFY